jgi:hypothetical protein
MKLTFYVQYALFIILKLFEKKQPFKTQWLLYVPPTLTYYHVFMSETIDRFWIDNRIYWTL